MKLAGVLEHAVEVYRGPESLVEDAQVLGVGREAVVLRDGVCVHHDDVDEH